MTRQITPSRGLRQGDHLLLYLFVLCSQGLSSIINQKAANNAIQGIKVVKGSPTITHLFFADDSLVFFKENRDNCNTIKECLRRYENASAQQINFEKSAITFSKCTPQSNILFIKNNLNLTVCQDHEVYLGLPTFLVQSKRIQFDYIRDRVAKRLDGWKNRLFLEGGREVLIKAVI